MSINRPEDIEVQNAMRSLAVIAAVVGAFVIAVAVSNSYIEMRDAKRYDQLRAEMYDHLMPPNHPSANAPVP